MMNIVNKFDTGQKNWDMLEHILRKNNFRLAASDVGGTIPPDHAAVYRNRHCGSLFAA